MVRKVTAGVSRSPVVPPHLWGAGGEGEKMAQTGEEEHPVRVLNVPEEVGERNARQVSSEIRWDSREMSRGCGRHRRERKDAPLSMGISPAHHVQLRRCGKFGRLG